MTVIDFFIGLTLMNSMPHFILGIWKGRMFSGFGFGNKQNIIYGVVNFIISLSLFHYKYGINTIFENGIYIGAIFIMVIYFITAKFWRNLFQDAKKS